MVSRSLFTECDEVNIKNRSKLLFDDVELITLIKFLPKYGVIDNTIYKLYYHCLDCGDPLERKVFQKLGFCATCDRA